MKISIDELKQMVSEAVNKRLKENAAKVKLNEGPEEISIRMVMSSIKSAVVDSIVEELIREMPNKDEGMLTGILSEAYETMTRRVVQDIERQAPAPTATPPRRKIVGGLGTGAAR